MPPIWIPSFERTIACFSGTENRSGERRVAEMLNEIASPDVYILPNLRYSVKKPTGASANLEIDFLVAWKNRGFMILEVKGGRIEYDALGKQWWCVPHQKPRKQYSRSPVEQVEGQKNDFCNDVLPRFLSKDVNPRNVVERALVFPDVCLSNFKDERGQRVHRIDDFETDWIVDRERLQSLASFVETGLEPSARYVRSRNIPSKLFEDIVHFLRSSVRAEVAPRHILEDSASRIEDATRKQDEALRHVIGNRKLLMSGPAGSAKTVLGLSAVLSWAMNGESACYITASKYLVAGLRKDPRYVKVRDKILTIHDFLEKVLAVKVDDNAESMKEALTKWEFQSKGFNVVIDEAQDLDYELYETLVSLLPSERLWVLRDSRQSLDRKNDRRKYTVGQMQHAVVYELTQNCRNTRLIAMHIAKYVDLPNDYVNGILPPGDRPPDVVPVMSTEEQDQKLIEILRQAEKDGWGRNSIVVISCLRDGGEVVRNKYCSDSNNNAGEEVFSYGGENPAKIALYHCLDFRGLESAFVVVTDIQDQDSLYRANYLSGSRAKCRLTIIRVQSEVSIAAGKSDIPEGLFFG